MIGTSLIRLSEESSEKPLKQKLKKIQKGEAVLNLSKIEGEKDEESFVSQKAFR